MLDRMMVFNFKYGLCCISLYLSDTLSNAIHHFPSPQSLCGVVCRSVWHMKIGFLVGGTTPCVLWEIGVWVMYSITSDTLHELVVAGQSMYLITC
jgi:hypothetical protein